MYANLLLFLVVLLIFGTYEPSEAARAQTGSPITALFFFLGFSLLVKIRFSLLARRLLRAGPNRRRYSGAHDRILSQSTYLAVALAIFYVWGLRLKLFLDGFSLVRAVPTLGAAAFMLFFALHLMAVWRAAYETHALTSPLRLSRRDYVRGQAMLGAPILAPWFLIEFLFDLLRLLPIPGLVPFLTTFWGEILFFAVFVTVLAVFGPAIIIRLWGCRPLPPGPARDRLENLAGRLGLNYSGLLQWPLFGGTVITAAVMGLVGRFRYILVTDGLLRLMTPEELDSVMAHEIGHVKKKHLVYYLVFLFGYMAFSFAFLLPLPYLLLLVFPLKWAEGFLSSGFFPGFMALAMILSFLLYFRFILGFFIRNFERQADLFALESLGTAMPLITCFLKIAAQSGRDPGEPNWHHFSIAERVDYLRRSEADPRWIDAHHRKVKRGLRVFFAGLVLASSLGLIFQFSHLEETLEIRALEQTLFHNEGRVRDADMAYLVIGNLQMERGRFERAITAYGKALSINPKNAEAANNLAWLYATVNDRGLRNPQRALELARHAAAIRPEPHILDTLAESLYVNGRFREALEVEQRAWEGASENRPFYREQMKKFQMALEGNEER